MAITTNHDCHERFCEWLKLRTGLVTIQSHLGGTRPALPYLMAHLYLVNGVREQPRHRDYFETTNLNSQGFPEILGIPEYETCWHFKVHSYGDNPLEVLRKLRSFVHLPQLQEPFYPDFQINDWAEAQYIPEFVNEQWEDRGVAKVKVVGITVDSDIIDTIDEASAEVDLLP